MHIGWQLGVINIKQCPEQLDFAWIATAKHRGYPLAIAAVKNKLYISLECGTNFVTFTLSKPNQVIDISCNEIDLYYDEELPEDKKPMELGEYYPIAINKNHAYIINSGSAYLDRDIYNDIYGLEEEEEEDGEYSSRETTFSRLEIVDIVNNKQIFNSYNTCSKNGCYAKAHPQNIPLCFVSKIAVVDDYVYVLDTGGSCNSTLHIFQTCYTPKVKRALQKHKESHKRLFALKQLEQEVAKLKQDMHSIIAKIKPSLETLELQKYTMQ